MSLRTAILAAALPSLSSTSFTRAALSNALRTLPTHDKLDSAAREGVLDTVFGAGIEGPVALVGAWEDAGSKAMTAAVAGPANMRPTERLTRVLSARLAYSATVGEHLTEAHALLAAGTPASVQLPDAVRAALQARMPSIPLYRSPGAAAANKAWEHGSAAATSVLDRTGGRLPLPSTNPAAPLAYAWRVADNAIYAARPHTGNGVMREPRGAGVEWYTSRAAIALAYLSAEAHLLQPYPAIEAVPSEGDANPHLPAALSSLRHNLRRLDDMRGAATAVENAVDSAISLFELSTRSIAGIIRSRGF